jgi:hypothetical protein
MKISLARITLLSAALWIYSPFAYSQDQSVGALLRPLLMTPFVPFRAMRVG